MNPDHWVAIERDGYMRSEEDYGSIRNLPDLDDVAELWVRGHRVDIPDDATPTWLRRVSINAGTGEQRVRIMIGWERGDEKEWHWVEPDGTVTVTNGDPD